MLVLASVVIPTCNKAEYLDRTLASFVNQTEPNYEIVLVDDGSTDHTRQVAESYRNRLPLVYHYQENKGRSAARNAALRLASGRFIIFNDDDRIVPPQYVASHLKHLNGDERTVVSGWKHSILTIWKSANALTQRESLELAAKLPDRINAAYLADHPDFELLAAEDFLHFDEEKLAPYIVRDGMDNFPFLYRDYGDRLEGFHFHWFVGTTANLSASKSLIEEAGGFDENFKGWGMEDTDLSYRLSKQGGQFVYSRDTYNFHQYHPRDAWQKVFKQNRKNQLYFASKYNNLETILYTRCMIFLLLLQDADKLMRLAADNPDIHAELTDTYRNALQDWKRAFGVQ